MSPLEGVSLLTLDKLFEYFNSDLGKKIEMPSANANCSARGLNVEQVYRTRQHFVCSAKIDTAV